MTDNRPMGALVRSLLFSFLLVCAMVLEPGALAEGPVAVRQIEGLVHGFLVLRILEGKTLANGDLIQVAHSDGVTNKLVFHFKDGSIRSETAVFSPRHSLRLLSDHVIQKGPAFKHAMETSIDGSTGQITVRYTEDDSKEKVATDRLELPPDNQTVRSLPVHECSSLSPTGDRSSVSNHYLPGAAGIQSFPSPN